VEYEERKVPNVGMYKGKPFYGSREERLDLVLRIRDYMDKKGMLTVSYPEEWYSVEPEKYAKEYMQRGRNVHLSPVHYRRHALWTDPKVSYEA